MILDNRLVVRAVWLLLAFKVSACFAPGPGVDYGVSDVMVLAGGVPLRGAQVELRQIDESGRPGALVDTGVTDARGTVQIATGTYGGPLLLTAHGGVMREYWSPDEDLPFPDEPGVVLQAVITDHIPGQSRQVVISPLTTLAEAFGRNRFELDLEPTYLDAMRHAHILFNEHVETDIVSTPPHGTLQQSKVAYLTRTDNHTLALFGLSALAHRIANEAGLSAPAWNTLSLLAALIQDASDDGAIFDGIGPDGAIVVASCVAPVCKLGPNTLRAHLVRELVIDFLRSEVTAHPLDLADSRLFLEDVAYNTEPLLFGTAAIEPIDPDAPRISMLESRLYDESRDRIAFGPNSRPIHFPVGDPSIDLRQSFGRDSCPLVFKHVNRLHSPDDNALRWKFVVADDIMGFLARDVEYRVGVRGPSTQWITDWRAATPSGELDGDEDAEVEFEREFEIVLLSDDIAELARIEGVLELEIQAVDWTGNDLSLKGCWEHVPLAPPLEVSDVEIVQARPDALSEVGLDRDNMASILMGESEPYLMFEFSITNGSQDPAYVTLQRFDPVATYSSTWLSSHAFERLEDGWFDCGDTCTAAPPGPVELSSVDQPIPPGVIDHRIIDHQGPVQVPCPGCTLNEFRLDAGRQHHVQTLIRTMQFMLPSPVRMTEIYELDLGPEGFTQRLTGVYIEEFENCYVPPMMMRFCDTLAHYQIYGGLISASFRALETTFCGKTRPSLLSLPRFPNAAASTTQHTLSEFISVDYLWNTDEPVLPPLSKP